MHILLTYRNATASILEKVAEEAKQDIATCCTKERHRPFTMNKEYLKRKEENLTAYAVLRHKDATTGLPSCLGSSVFRLQDGSGALRTFSATDDNLVTVLSAYGVHLSSPTQLARIHADEFDAELDVISHVAAYFDIASTRIIDNIPQLFETMFASKFAHELEERLTTDLKLLGTGGLDRCKRYVRDEPDIQFRRDTLSRERKILKEALATIDRFYNS